MRGASDSGNVSRKDENGILVGGSMSKFLGKLLRYVREANKVTGFSENFIGLTAEVVNARVLSKTM